MRVPDLAGMIDDWEDAHSNEVMEMINMTVRDKLFKQESKRMMNLISAVYQIPFQQVGMVDKEETWTPTPKKKQSK